MDMVGWLVGGAARGNSGQRRLLCGAGCGNDDGSNGVGDGGRSRKE